jgi:tetraacyldisaccharide 4'-kinase
MVSESPPFWWKNAGWQAWALWPFSLAYGAVAARIMKERQRFQADCPVICVGNFTVGGAGKTPTAITLARAAIAKGLKPGILSRGYGGSLDRTTVVDPDHHRAMDVGDEPLLLARVALTVISRNRIDGAKKLVAEGVDLIIMDDGFQSARLHLDFALVVLDTVRGLGNGYSVPSGPVRAPIRRQLPHVTALLKVGKGNAADRLVRLLARAGKPIYEASIVPRDVADLKGQRVLAFAGIADPEKFYRTVAETGAEIVETASFGDHQHLSEDQISDLIDLASAKDLQIVTTAKDHVRLRGGHGRADELLQRARVIEVEMQFDGPSFPSMIIDRAFASFKERKLAAISQKKSTVVPELNAKKS